MKREKRKTALVLAGGGIPGWMYEIGALTALDDLFSEGFSINDFDIYVGTSAGAAVASLIANRVKPRTIFQAILEDQESPFNYNRTNVYGLLSMRDIFCIGKKILKSFFPVLKSYLRERKHISRLDLFHLLQENLPSGFFSLKNLDNHLATFFSQDGYTNDFRKLARELYIPAVDIDRGRYDVFGEEGFSDVPISTAVIASSAMPIFFQPVQIRGRDYVDGGVGRVAHMDIAINHGAGLIFVITPVQYIINDRSQVCLPTISGYCASLAEKGLSYIYDQSLRINHSTRLHLAFKRYLVEYPDKDFLLIQPKPSETIMFLHSIISLQLKREILLHGYHSTTLFFLEQFPRLQEIFARHGIKVSLDKLQGRESRPQASVRAEQAAEKID